MQAFGGPENLALVNLPDPNPAAGQVSIATEAIGVGGLDALMRSGSLTSFGYTPGRVLGNEVAGVVTAVGAGVDTEWIGRRVWAFTGEGGGYAEQAVAAAAMVVPLPSALSAADAVTLGTSAMVAHFALRHAHFARGESVLVRGAAGGIGVMVVQLAARAGASAVGVTTSSAERGERLRELGATHVLDRAGDGADARAGYDVIIDIVAGADLPSFFARLNPNGRMVVVGAMAGMPPADWGAEMVTAFRKSLSFATFSADTIPAADKHAGITELFAAAGRGELEAVVHKELPLRQAVAAHHRMDAGEVFGRIVLAV
ncbi:NADPH:quinone reductase-like Zn-dependent oxidoreductase [Nocardia pseudobrasiliensis]|uniref:NADPH:quinone reductase-like Zn-dependent oxidoreductase n=1 Tax=Nocardia pseudobrasiliensis TaxID=45979 RepID=A0A370IHY0_9NOCA|nr:NADPH:quinone reductase-like Zn-dependent oxidoreductase [Nocardia pseudobrasiliensis]